MRGHENPQQALFSYVSLEARVSPEHPLRQVRRMADEILTRLNPVLEEMYSSTGRPSIPPERLLKSMILIALYSIRSDRLFCEMLDYNMLFRWFLGMGLDEPSFDHSSFSRNRERLLEHEVARLFFEQTVGLARNKRLMSSEHFTVDGTMIEAWASLKSFQPKDARAREQRRHKDDDDDRGNPTVNFHGERRGNATHASTTDPEARLLRKSHQTGAKLCFIGNFLMENRNGLCVDMNVMQANGRAERDGADRMTGRLRRRGFAPKTLGADKGYYVRDFIDRIRRKGIAPHVASYGERKTPGMDGRTLRHASYAISQRIRKRVEEMIGWCKTVGGLRRSRFRGIARTQQYAQIVAGAYNLLRIPRLVEAGP